MDFTTFILGKSPNNFQEYKNVKNNFRDYYFLFRLNYTKYDNIRFDSLEKSNVKR